MNKIAAVLGHCWIAFFPLWRLDPKVLHIWLGTLTCFLRSRGLAYGIRSLTAHNILPKRCPCPLASWLGNPWRTPRAKGQLFWWQNTSILPTGHTPWNGHVVHVQLTQSDQMNIFKNSQKLLENAKKFLKYQKWPKYVKNMIKVAKNIAIFPPNGQNLAKNRHIWSLLSLHLAIFLISCFGKMTTACFHVTIYNSLFFYTFEKKSFCFQLMYKPVSYTHLRATRPERRGYCGICC